MYPRHATPKQQQGSMIVIALFIIVVMSLLGIAMTQVLSASSDAVIHEVHGVRALNAAQSGVQAKVAQAFPLSGVGSCDDTLDLDLSSVPGLENCTVRATCSLTPFDGGNINYYRFNSVGTCAAGDIVASREVAVDAKVE